MHTWEDKIKMYFVETGFEGVNWIQLVKNSVEWCASVNVVLCFVFHKIREFFV
jgi:hypothetical protein